ncbi:MAG: hypothetical protein K2M64_00335, partial [Clostridia bacterium]|nr:hypothetical protein [Clostridia bacterium]
SYARFASEVLKPFKSAGENLLREVDPDSLNAEYVAQAEEYFTVEKAYIESNTMASIFTLMEDVRLILIDQQLDDELSNDVAVASEYLVNAMYLKNRKIIKIAYIAYKNTLRSIPVASQKLAEIIKLFDTIKF